MKPSRFQPIDPDRDLLIRSDYRKSDTGVDKYGEYVHRVSGIPEKDRYFNTMTIRPGFSLVYSDFVFKTPVNLRFEIEAAPVQFVFAISGTNVHTVHQLGKVKREIRSSPGVVNMFYIPGTSGDCTFSPGKKQAMVGLHLDPQLLMTMAGDAPGGLGGFSSFISRRTREGRFVRPSRMTPGVALVSHQIINCPYKGPVKNLYLESKAVELLALHLDALMNESGNSVQKSNLTDRDVEKIHAARDMLVRDLKHPPTIARLARKAGLNEFKLKSGFREIFNTTVFGYLQRHKMETAKLLMETGDLNVNEIAWAVGYANVSHFIAAFRKNTGVNPGYLLKQRRRVRRPGSVRSSIKPAYPGSPR